MRRLALEDRYQLRLEVLRRPQAFRRPGFVVAYISLLLANPVAEVAVRQLL